ncbi:ABC transporter substrate-binding protein [Rubrobacter aplysinae]|uniref:ABC transporter substrate-binding protein n=1 Tax=Rubrobacter aplysinae TaxID=909625 RepID=UPI00064BE2D9|nr:spermidine/putrescine ABC transporter substrate-binding protein [Rubrobacter aplysinae]
MGRGRISRGRFLKVMGAGAVAGSTLSVLSCQANTSANSGGGNGDGGSNSGGNKLNLYNWSDYVAESTLPDFEEKTGAKVTQDFYSSNEELLAKLQAGGSGYDVIVPSDTMVEIMIKSDVVQPLDKSKIPNFENVGNDYKGLFYDPENEYSMPYQWGTTGILYNKKEVGQIKSWDAMWNPEYKGKIAMIDELPEILGAAYMKLGYSINNTEPGPLEEVKALLKEQKPLLRGYFASTEIRPAVQNGDVLLGHSYSGDAFIALTENEDLDYVLPEEGALRWFDNMCIPNGAKNVDLAHEFINYILAKKSGAELSNYTYYSTPNEAALPLIDDELKQLPNYSPSGEEYKRLQIDRVVGEAVRERQRVFTEVKSA